MVIVWHWRNDVQRKCYSGIVALNFDFILTDSSQLAEGAAFLRLEQVKTLWKTGLSKLPDEVTNTTSGPNSPDIELVCAPITFWKHGQIPAAAGNKSFTIVGIYPTALWNKPLLIRVRFRHPLCFARRAVAPCPWRAGASSTQSSLTRGTSPIASILRT